MPFTVTIIRAFDLHNTEFFGEQHVYAEVRIGMDTRCTGQRHGTHPNFDDTFLFEGPIQSQHLEFALWSTHMTGPRLVGRGRFPLAEAEALGRMTQFIPLFEESGKQKGQLEISVAFRPAVAAVMVAPPVAYAPQPPPMMMQPVYPPRPAVVEEVVYAPRPAVVEEVVYAPYPGVVEEVVYAPPPMYDPYAVAVAETVALDDMSRRRDRDLLFDEMAINAVDQRQFDRDVYRDERRDVRAEERFDRDVNREVRRDEFFF